MGIGPIIGWRQDNGNWSNQELKFDFLATRQCLVKIDKKIKSSAPADNQIYGLLPINFLPLLAPPYAPTDNQIYGVPANQFSPSAGTTLITHQNSGIPANHIFSLCWHHPNLYSSSHRRPHPLRSVAQEALPLPPLLPRKV